MAITPAELPCSIVLAVGDRNRRRSRSYSRWSHNMCRSSLWRSDVDTWSFNEWFCLEPLGKMIAKRISKASTNETKDRPIDWTNKPIKPTIDWLRPTNWVIENDGLARPATLAKAKTNWEAIDWTITIPTNIADGIR